MSALRSSSDIRKLSGIVDVRRSRTPHGALLEMSMLEMERQRLAAESARTLRRCAEIAQRIADIDSRQQRLQGFVEKRDPSPVLSVTPAKKMPVATSSRLKY